MEEELNRLKAEVERLQAENRELRERYEALNGEYESLYERYVWYVQYMQNVQSGVFDPQELMDYEAVQIGNGCGLMDK